MVRHLIVFNTQASETEVRAMFDQARAVLGQIPGVLGFELGQALGEPRYRYLLIVDFADESVIPYYREHPLHQQFADQVFRPMAQDRLTTDFVRLYPEGS